MSIYHQEPRKTEAYRVSIITEPRGNTPWFWSGQATGDEHAAFMAREAFEAETGITDYTVAAICREDELEDTDADRFSALLHDDGQCWEDDDGRTFYDLTREFGATHEVYRDNDDDAPYRISKIEATASDRERYVFPDGSAIVVIGDGWDNEGDAPGTWRG